MTTVTEPSLAPAVDIDRSGFLALLGGTFIIAWSPIVVRFADVGPISSAAWRMMFALPVLLAWTRHLASLRGPDVVRTPLPRWVKAAAVLSGFAFAGDVAVFHLSLGATDVANAAFISNIAPILVMFGGAVFYRERPPALIWAALCLALLGSWMMAGLAAPTALGRGDVFAVLAAIFYACYLLFTKHVRTRLDGPAASCWTAAVSAVILLAVALSSGEKFLPTSIHGWIAVVFLGVVSHAGGQGLTAIAIGRVPVGLVAVVILTWAPVSAFLAWLILGESLNALQVYGAAVILCALVLAHPRWSRG
jgi:drug/metabolite transporter (DMT)-like permease